MSQEFRATTQNKVRFIAFYLPQFHPIPENNEWWGPGFTEWFNVSRAKPLFSGHHQPHIPGDLGFYDLRLPEARLAQASLAADSGIEGFCYWHYWLNGQRLLQRPFNEVLDTGEPDFPFCLAWANETWSKRWLGEEKSILMQQTYSEEDDVNHAQWLLRAFADSRYIHVQGKPLFLVYRPLDLPEPQATTDLFRRTCVFNGLPEPYLVGIDAHSPQFDFRKVGFDSSMKFAPQLGFLPDFLDDGLSLSKLRRNWALGIFNAKLKIYDVTVARRLMTQSGNNFPNYPCVFVGWDNTPRRGDNGIIILNSNPIEFEIALVEAVQNILQKSYEDRLIFINAWNEWAEGNYLEPDLRYGRGYLDALKRVANIS